MAMTATRRKKNAARRRTSIRAPVLPRNMQAASIDRFGPPEVLTFHELRVPKVGPNEVMIAIQAAGVGTWDASVRDGSWKPIPRPRFPLVLGTDGAGIVVARGARVRRFQLGDRVWAADVANRKGGFYAEFTAVNADHVGRPPEHLDPIAAGAAPIPGLTALQGVDDALRLQEGETVLIFGASGAVGTLAIQFARLRKAKVLATASGDDARQRVLDLGAGDVIDARQDDFVDGFLAFAPDGFDTVLAFAGGEALERCVDHVRDGGRVAFPNGVEPVPRRRQGIRFTAYDGKVGRRQFERLTEAANESRLRVPIMEVFPLEEAARAHQRLEDGHIIGRLVIKVR
jgi:NADPH:quinone reductase